jgi:hypothetical protein
LKASTVAVAAAAGGLGLNGSGGGAPPAIPATKSFTVEGILAEVRLLMILATSYLIYSLMCVWMFNAQTGDVVVAMQSALMRLAKLTASAPGHSHMRAMAPKVLKSTQAMLLQAKNAFAQEVAGVVCELMLPTSQLL